MDVTVAPIILRLLLLEPQNVFYASVLPTISDMYARSLNLSALNLNLKQLGLSFLSNWDNLMQWVTVLGKGLAKNSNSFESIHSSTGSFCCSPSWALVFSSWTALGGSWLEGKSLKLSLNVKYAHELFTLFVFGLYQMIFLVVPSSNPRKIPLIVWTCS